MPGTPINTQQTHQIDKLHMAEPDDKVNSQYKTNTVVRDITQTDKLNKKLLESVLERISKTDNFHKFVDNTDKEDDKSDFK